ncbi:MAG: amidase [Gemmatimonadetes bacterium]|nr:amidase [Gemmatimonadota bacterium]
MTDEALSRVAQYWRAGEGADVAPGRGAGPEVDAALIGVTAPDQDREDGLDRRAFVGYFTSIGLGATLLPGVLWAQQQQEQGPVTKAMIAQAEQIAGLEFTDAEREEMVRGLNQNVRAWQELHQVALDNAVAPAVQFDPVLPGVTFPTERRSPRWSDPGEVRRPSNLEEVAYWPVRRLAEMIRSRQVTSVELTTMYLERMKRYGPTLECVITLTESRAMEAARRADAEVAGGRYRGLLHGVPWGGKDLLAMRGARTTWGAKPYEEQIIDVDATVVERLDAAGAVLLAKLTLGALAQGDQWYGGRTRNPWNTEQGSSGSSAGSAAATAAGLVGFSIGTETLGSIVSPSTRCGVTGLRPTFGRVSRHGAMALVWSMDKIGPICRSAEDCAIVFDAIRGPDGRDPTVRDLPFNFDATTRLADLRIGYVRSAFDAERETKAFDDAVLDVLRAGGATLMPIEMPADYPLNPLRTAILNAESAASFDALTRSNRDDLMERSSWPNSFRTARLIPAVEYVNANRVRTLVMRAMHDVMQQVDVFVAPTTGNSVLLLTNLTGHPAIVLPTAFRADGTPFSIQFVGRLYGEAELLAVAKAYQDATDWHSRRPPGFP